MKDLMLILSASLALSASASADVNCAQIDLTGSWDNGRTVVSRDPKTGALSGVDQGTLNDFAGTIITRMYYDIQLDTAACVISQVVTKTSTAKAVEPGKEVFQIEDGKTEGVLRTYSIRSFFKVLEYTAIPEGRILTLAECADAACAPAGYKGVFTLKSRTINDNR